jgi:hypothetical protein
MGRFDLNQSVRRQAVQRVTDAGLRWCGLTSE